MRHTRELPGGSRMLAYACLAGFIAATVAGGCELVARIDARHQSAGGAGADTGGAGNDTGGGGADTGGSTAAGGAAFACAQGGAGGGAGGAGGGVGGGTLPDGCWTGATQCNPLTNSPCGPGEVCDYDSVSGLMSCYPPPNTQGCGEQCSWDEPPYCMSTLICNPWNRCADNCCSASDCLPGYDCVPVSNLGTYGYCTPSL